ncbi:hypothetical protein [Arcticibacterium luteifluviistationis]|nr:hypothetical protein [Arcticibacterium luteifluviistationis]
MYKPLLFSILIFSVGCNKVVDLNIIPFDGEDDQAVVISNDCKIKTLESSDGLTFAVEYDDDKPLTIKGNLPSFDKFLYNGNLLTGAQLSVDPSSQIIFTFDGKGNLSRINFKGSDARGPFDYPTTMTYDAKNRLTALSLSLPIFNQPADVELEYNADDNITKVVRKTDFFDETLLVNHTFDDKKSPFLDQRLGQILSYFMVYTLIQGDNNYTNFLNKNNVTSSTITNDNGKTELSTEYTYDQNDYPTQADIVKVFQGRIRQASGSYTYKCN